MPVNNAWAALSAIGVSVSIFVLEALVKFFDSGSPWPADVAGWERIVIPAVAAGALAALTPRISMHELRTGHRRINTLRGDVPVVDEAAISEESHPHG